MPVNTGYVPPMPLTNEIFAGEMRAQIARKQLTSGELASELHLSSSTVNRLLTGKQTWSLVNATLAANWAGLDLSDFLGESK